MIARRRAALVLPLVLACVGCDQVTKEVAERHLAGSVPISFAGDLLRLHYVENAGAFLGLGAELPATARALVFVGLVALALAALLVYALGSRRLRRLEVVAVTLIVAGGLGNLIDRLWLGAVRDFLNVGVGGLRTGIFNVADMAITAGALLVLVGMVTSPREEQVPPPPPVGPPTSGPPEPRS